MAKFPEYYWIPIAEVRQTHYMKGAVITEYFRRGNRRCHSCVYFEDQDKAIRAFAAWLAERRDVALHLEPPVMDDKFFYHEEIIE